MENFFVEPRCRLTWAVTTKFYKSRLAPVGPQLAEVLKAYMPWRLRGNLSEGKTSYLLANRDGTRLASSTVQAAFDALRRIAGIHGAAGGRRSAPSRSPP